MSKSLRIILTEQQLQQLHEHATQAGISANELVRRVLIEKGIIPEDDLKHGGYRKRKDKEE